MKVIFGLCFLSEILCVQGAHSGLHRGGRKFGGLGLQGQPDGYPARNIFKGSFTEDRTEAGKDISEGVFKYTASDSRKKFDRIASTVQIEKYWHASPSTKEYQKLEGKLKHDSTGERLDQGAIGE